MSGGQSSQRLTDGELVARAVRGDKGAFAALLYSVSKALLRRIRKRIPPTLQSQIDPEDVLIEACCKALPTIRGFRGKSRLSFAEFLKSIADNLVADIERRASHQRRVVAHGRANKLRSSATNLLEIVQGRERTPSSVAAERERSLAVRVAMACLTEGQRKALWRVHLDGLNRCDAAEELGVSVTALNGLLFRGKRSLHRILGDMTI